MLVLASQSPRRKQLLMEHINVPFIIEPSNINETLNKNETPIENVLRLSKEKGLDVYSRHKDDVIISSDTVVVINNHILGKPKDLDEAKRFLYELSNKTHEVITAYSIISKNVLINKYVISLVTFKKLSEFIIDKYISATSPLDKAGAYAIQDEQSKDIIASYSGSLSNIIGLPIEELISDLKNLKII